MALKTPSMGHWHVQQWDSHVVGVYGFYKAIQKLERVHRTTETTKREKVSYTLNLKGLSWLHFLKIM